MWGFGGKYYWKKRDYIDDDENNNNNDDNNNNNNNNNSSGSSSNGIVVVFAWMSSEERQLDKFVRLYSSLGWDSLVCHSQFLNMFFPEKAAGLALDIVLTLAEELKKRPCPIVFASFSGGPKACIYKVLQIIEQKCDIQLNRDDCQLVQKNISGFIYDSSPVDFTSDLGARFAVHPSVLKVSSPPRVVSWLANNIASGLDALFLSRFESHRAEYWQTLYSSASMGAPYLILCSKHDDLAPFQTISNFAERLRELGADVKLVKWDGSPHVGHYKHYPIDYKAAVSELLGKAAAIYSQRNQHLNGGRIFGYEGTRDEIPEAFCKLKRAALGSNQGFWGVNLGPSSTEQFLSSGSSEYYGGSVQGVHKEDLIHLPNLQSISAHGILGQILYDVCVPKNVEDWDIGWSTGSHHSIRRRNAPFNPIKCIRRSRL